MGELNIKVNNGCNFKQYELTFILFAYLSFTAQKMKFSIKDFLWIWSHFLKKSLMENFIFSTVFYNP